MLYIHAETEVTVYISSVQKPVSQKSEKDFVTAEMNTKSWDVVFKVLDYQLEGHEFKSQIHQAVIAGPLSEALYPQLLRCIKM